MTAVVRTTSLSKSFGGVRAVHGVDLDVKAGEIVGIVGPNGAGKTTLFNLVTGSLRPTSGSVEIFGKSVNDLPPHRRNHLGIGRTFQTPQNFGSLTVRENIATAMVASLERRSWAGFHVDKARQEHVLDVCALQDMAERPASQLALLAQGRLQIGLALATSAKVLLLDEPSGGLVEHEVKEMADFIQDLRDSQGLTIVVIDHKMRLIMSICDRVMAMATGEVLVFDTPSVVAGDSAVQEAYLGVPKNKGSIQR